jgi:D-tyrosyl-tRNA(Tyr) deacylase
VAALEGEGIATATGRFGAMMDVELINDGPVTIWLDSGEMMAGG